MSAFHWENPRVFVTGQDTLTFFQATAPKHHPLVSLTNESLFLTVCTLNYSVQSLPSGIFSCITLQVFKSIYYRGGSNEGLQRKQVEVAGTILVSEQFYNIHVQKSSRYTVQVLLNVYLHFHYSIRLYIHSAVSFSFTRMTISIYYAFIYLT